MPDLGERFQHQFGGVLAGGHKPPCAPFAAVTFAEPDIRQIGERLAKGIEHRFADLGIDVDHHRAVPRSPVPRHLLGPVEGGVYQHDDTDAHAQLPLDMRPRISN